MNSPMRDMLRTKVGKFHVCWYAIVVGQIYGTSISHISQIELVHSVLIHVGHVTVPECVFCILWIKEFCNIDNIITM